MTDQASIRDRFQADLDARYDQLLAVIDEGLAATKRVWVSCPHCKRRSEVDVPDTKAALEAAEFTANRSLGRPGVESDPAESERIIFERVVYMTDEGPQNSPA